MGPGRGGRARPAPVPGPPRGCGEGPDRIRVAQAAPAPRPPPTSVVVVSRGRPRALARCLAALVAQDHPCLELVLVADPPSAGLRPDLPIKRVAFDIPNISAARNAGIAQAAGEVVLFVDDDAVPAASWARRLALALAEPGVIAATGFTRGPDGLSWQCRAERITPSGQALPIAVAGPSLLGPEGGSAVSTLGTNCGFRREALLAVGGFDPAFAFHLDESDLDMRLAARFPDGLTAVLPEAEVIHAMAPGTARDAARLPHDLRAIGRSTAIFAVRHGGTTGWLEPAQRRRLLRLMVAGRMDPLAVGRVLATLRAGLAEAPRAPPPPPGPVAPDPAPPFLPLPTRPARVLFLAGWHWQARALRRHAAAATARGREVRLLLLSPGILPHRLVLTEGGWWEQRGGLWGPSQPGDPAVTFSRLSARIRRERACLALMRR